MTDIDNFLKMGKGTKYAMEVEIRKKKKPTQHNEATAAKNRRERLNNV